MLLAILKVIAGIVMVCVVFNKRWMDLSFENRNRKPRHPLVIAIWAVVSVAILATGILLAFNGFATPMFTVVK